jgi:hypothetical protein
MNYDRNGVLVTTSRPKPVLRKSYRVVTIDSRDRDPTKYVRQVGGSLTSDPGDYVVYFPRPFQKVTRIRLMSAILLGVLPSDNYILMNIEGLNRMDETASGADRSGYVDAAFAKIVNDRPVVSTGPSFTVGTISAIANRTGNLSGSIQPTGTGSIVTYTTSAAHNLNIGLTLTIAGTTNYNNSSAVIVSTPTTTTFTVASTQVGAGSTGGSYTVQNLQYTYTLTATTSYTIGQYVTVSGLSGTQALLNANVTSIILSTPSTTTFETTNLVSSPTTTLLAGNAVVGQAIYYNDMSYTPNTTYYNPPIGTLDRMRITLRRHLPLSSITATTPANQPITFGPAENSFTFEIEYLDNGFEDVSTFETRLDNSNYTPREYA